MYYTKEMDEIATEAVKVIEENLDTNSCYLINNICRQYALESIAYIMLGSRLDAFKGSYDAKRLIEIADESGTISQQVAFLPSQILKYLPLYKNFVRYLNYTVILSKNCSTKSFL